LQEPVSVMEPFAGFGQAMENTFRWVIKIFIFGLSFLILVIPFAIFFIVIFLIVKLIIKLVRAFSKPKEKLEVKKG
jgi:large-conductance mechanosensitive channel